jgi:hypothetical protein
MLLYKIIHIFTFHEINSREMTLLGGSFQLTKSLFRMLFFIYLLVETKVDVPVKIKFVEHKRLYKSICLLCSVTLNTI